MSAPTICRVVREPLSDGSATFTVVAIDTERRSVLTIYAYDEAGAARIAEAINAGAAGLCADPLEHVPPVPSSEIILDDGQWYVELNCNYPAEDAPGFLQARCPAGPTTPGGFECVGSFERDTITGHWRASVNAPLDPATDSDSLSLGAFPDRLSAIAVLWRRRHEALRRHPGR